MRPITAKGGITGSDLPAPRGRVKIAMVELRPKFKIDSVDHKALLRVCKLMDISVSEWIRRQTMRALGNDA